MKLNSIKAEIAVSLTAYSFDKPFTYSVPKEFNDSIKIGSRVIVSFGKGNRKRVGIVLSLEKLIYEDMKLKPIVSVIDSEPLLNDEMMDMLYWLKENTFCTFFDALKTIVPSGMNIRINEKYSLAKDIVDNNLSVEEENILSLLRRTKIKSEFDNILEGFNTPDKKKIVNSLVEKGIILKTNEYKRNVQDSFINMIKLSEEYILANKVFKITPKQKTVIKLLEENGSSSVKEACYICNVTKSVINNLIKNGVVEEYEYETFRIPKNENSNTKFIEDIVLNQSQQLVFEEIRAQFKTGKPKCFLLHGVTGSGKTSVFKRLIAETLDKGRQALLLIPEISLTPQIVNQFQEIFGETVAVLHSNLSLGQRTDEYKRIKQGKSNIVIGTRSAIFAPLDNIGIIIMDEEGERSYKSDSSPRYNTVDVAKKRCKAHNAVLLLASATPSIESYYYAQKGVYKLLEMNERYSNAPLPDVTMIDMNEERANGNISEFSELLIHEIRHNLEHGEQSILLLNRRGYHTIISCCKCNKPVYCINCSIPLTYHKANGSLMCHYCGYSCGTVEKCSECGSDKLKQMGFGTQKLEEELYELFSDSRILRMDADTTFSRYAYEKKFKDFADGKYDIMIGTQMISKGLDFPNVTLVGVLSVDKALFSGDFRSYERTFSLITQVVGRGGRGDKPGRAYLQTFMPEHYVLNLASNQNYKSFYNEEICIRRALINPPICDICVLGFSSQIEKNVQNASNKMLEIIKNKVKTEKVEFPLRVLGPVKCAYGKINGKYRYRLIMKCKNTAIFRKFVSEILIETYKHREFSRVITYADINGDIGI